MRELFKAMIVADKELPRSMVIAQLKWQRLAEPAEHTEVRQNGEWYETALVRGHEALTVLLKRFNARFDSGEAETGQDGLSHTD